MEDTYIGVAKRKIAFLMRSAGFSKITEIESTFVCIEFDKGESAKVDNFGRVTWANHDA